MPRIIILGTGTDVGKTYVSSRLAILLANDPNTQAIIALKPIESGVLPHTSDKLYQPRTHRSDAEILADASLPPIPAPSHAYALADPVSPHLAARRNGQNIDISVTANWIRQQERQCCKEHYTTLHHRYKPSRPGAAGARTWTVIETAGSVFTPLAKAVTNFTLAHLLEPSIWILVAPDRLGVLHDLSVTLLAMRHFGRTPDSIVLSEPANSDSSTGTNADELRELGIAETDATIGRGSPLPSHLMRKLIELANSRGL